MPFNRPTPNELLLRNQAEMDANIPGGFSRLRQSLENIIARVLALASHEMYGYLGWQFKQLFVTTAESEYLENNHAAPLGISRKAATTATGTVRFTGTIGAVILAGTLLTRGDDVKYSVVNEVTDLGKLGQQSIPIIIWTGVAYAGAFIGKRTGHGGGMDAGTHLTEPNAGRKFEYFEFIIYPLHGKIERYWYDILLLTITGLVVTIVPGILLFLHDPFWGVFLGLSGATKGLAYMIGWAIYPNGRGKGYKWINEPSAIGEVLTGFFGYLFLGITAIAFWV